MGRRGPPKKPTHLKVVAGTYRKDRALEGELCVAAGMPEPPSHLAPLALEEWRRVAPELVRLGVLSPLDRAALGAYCQAYARWVAAEEALARVAAKDPTTHGIILRTASGNPIQNPLVGAANKASQLMQRFAAELGLTPAGRTGVKGNGQGAGSGSRYFT